MALALLVAIVPGAAMADPAGKAPLHLAGVIMAPEDGKDSAAQNRARAAGYSAPAQAQVPAQAASSPVPLDADLDEAVLLPRENLGTPDSISKARAYGQGGKPVVIEPDLPGTGQAAPDSTSQTMSANRSKAHAYMKASPDSRVVGPGALPLVNCGNVDNSAGRIGDDSTSGNVIVLIRDGKQVKVRCQ